MLLVRHGHVPGIEPERFRGGADLDLTDRGLEEARLTAERIAGHWQPVQVYTSARSRCIETGRIIAARCAIAHRVLAEIGDLDYGEWTDHTHEEIRARHPEEYRRWRSQPHLVRFPGGNCLQEVLVRMADALRHVARVHAGSTVVLVGHDSGNRTLMLHALGLPLSAYWSLRQSPCGISELVLSGESVQVVRMNETAHLEGPALRP